jgi:tetratricopeptide (TPR) repeat protein
MIRKFGIKLMLGFAVLCCAALGINAQDVNNGEIRVRAYVEIRGDVRSAESGQPITGVLVRCSGTGGISDWVTQRDGKFLFRVSPGQYTVTVQASGFQSAERSTTLTDYNASDYLPFRLKPDLGSPKPVATAGINANVPPAAQKAFEKAEAALALNKKESTQQAIVLYQEALTAYPKFVEAQLKLGTAYMDLADWDKAELNLKKALELDPKATNAMFALGEVYLRQKKADEAEKILLQALQLEDRSAQGHLALARVYVDMAAKIKDPEQNRPFRVKAYDQVNESLKYDANNSLAHWIKGNLLVSVGRNVDAQHEFEEYLRLDPKGAWADKAKGLIERIKAVEKS